MIFRQLVKNTNRYGASAHGGRVLRVAGICSVWVALLVIAWGPNVTEPFRVYGPPVVQALSADVGDLRQRQVAFLHRLRQADPRYETIEKAVFNAQNELGIILNRQTQMDAVRPLMRTILTQMAREFPGLDLMVIVYAPTEPPMEIGTARLDARTREMTYIPAVPH